MAGVRQRLRQDDWWARLVTSVPASSAVALAGAACGGRKWRVRRGQLRGTGETGRGGGDWRAGSSAGSEEGARECRCSGGRAAQLAALGAAVVSGHPWRLARDRLPQHHPPSLAGQHAQAAQPARRAHPRRRAQRCLLVSHIARPLRRTWMLGRRHAETHGLQVTI